MLNVVDVRIAIAERVLLDGVTFQVLPGESVAIMGPSGSGKTSLLNCLSGISVPARGDVWLSGTRLNDLSRGDRAKFRLDHIGVVFQFGELLPELTAEENVALPARLGGSSRESALEAARLLLERLGLGSLRDSRPESLSGGEQQRIAIARALVRQPELLVADEPTGMLDEKTSAQIIAMLTDITETSGASLVVVTHDEQVARSVGRVLRIHDGVLVDEPSRSP